MLYSTQLKENKQQAIFWFVSTPNIDIFRLLGTCLFWEFATETYDVGFGVSFEWTLPSSEAITVEVHDDEDGETVQDGEHNETQKQRIDEILPTIRRPCNEEVMVGSHLYPGRGVYLLRFDNSYSLFRSKTLFYRVYYTR
jgi:hypothetical protein